MEGGRNLRPPDVAMEAEILQKGTEMGALLRRLARSEEAQDLAEYGIAMGVIVAFTGLIALAIAEDIETLWSNAQSSIADVTTP